MSEQNQRFHSHNQEDEAPILTPSHKLIKKKLCQLQNKAFFFEGQLNPLVGENQKLKAQLTLLNKSVIASTDLLRSLLPIGSCQTKRLKLQLATIEEICDMIKEDWYMMEDQIERKTFAIDILDKKIMSNKEEYEKGVSEYKRETQIIINQKNESILMLQESQRKLQSDMEITRINYQKQIIDIKQLFKFKVERIQKLQKELTLYSRQVQTRYRQYEKNIQRLKVEIASNLVQFQEGKKNLRDIYDKLMTEKIQEQADMFNSLLRSKEQEKDRLMLYYQDKQQQFQQNLNQKSETIQVLQNQNQINKQQIQKNQRQLFQTNKNLQQISQQAHNYKTSLQSQILTKQLTQQKLKKKQAQLLQKQRTYQEQLSQIYKNRSISQQQLNNKIIKLSKDYDKLNEQFNEKSQTLMQTEKSLATLQRKYTRKLQEEQNKWAIEKQLLQEKASQLQNLIKEKQALIEEKLSQMTKMSLQKQEQLKQQEQKSAEELKNLRKRHQKEIQMMNSSTSQQLAYLKRQNQRILSQQRIKSNIQMQTLQQQLMTKMTLKQQQFNNLKTQLLQQLISTKLQLQQKQLQLQQLQTKNQQISLRHNLQLQQLKEESQRAMDQLNKQCEQDKKKIQQEMINQLMEFQIEMEKRSAEYQTHLEKIQAQMMNEINLLKSSNALQQLQAKFLTQITSIKKQHQLQLISMQEKQKQSQQSLIDQQKRQIQRLIQQYQQDMTRLAKKLQSDIQNLNSQLFDQQKQHEITKMTRQEKIKYLSKKINQLKIISQQKQNHILELQLLIQEYQKQQDRINQIIEQRVNVRRGELQIQKNQFLKECQITVDKTRLQAQKKVQQAQKDRLQHSQSMYLKFHQLNILHQQQLNRILKRYQQLEKLFAQRPSRAQDLTKIKELMEIKQKMDLQMITYHKKVQHANQIVKYLNLQLQNYKDTYDMFGPCDDSTQKTIAVQSISCETPVQSIMKLKKINYRINTQGTEVLYSSQNKYETTTPKINHLRISNDSPSFREFQLYPGNKLNQSQTLNPPQSGSLNKIPYNRKSPQIIVNNRIKKASSIDKSGQIVLNAQNFLKLINNNSKNTAIVRQNKSNDRRAYRKSKPRRLNILGMGNGENYSLARKQSFEQQFPLK